MRQKIWNYKVNQSTKLATDPKTKANKFSVGPVKRSMGVVRQSSNIFMVKMLFLLIKIYFETVS